MLQTGFDHIAIALSRITDAAEILVGVLGGEPLFGLRRPGFSFFQWRFAGGGRIEVLEPRGDDGFVHRFLGARGPGIHHVTFTVPDLRAACARAEAAGYTIVGYEDTTPHWAEAFLHPRQAGGIVVQLAQSSGEEMPLRWAPPAPPDPPPPVTLLGLRLRLRSREHAHRQWGEVLGGECVDETDSTLTYRWPASPMRIVIEIDGARDEGPSCLEIAGEQSPRLSPDQSARLGVVVSAVAVRPPGSSRRRR